MMLKKKNYTSLKRKKNMPLLINDVIQYVEENITSFHEKRLNKIETLKLKEVLQKKNPYLFKAKNIQTADEIVKGIVDAYLFSSEEAMFGDWLEGLAIFINGKDNNPDKGTYFKYCGQRFWEFIGGNENIYIDIIEPLGHKAKERNENYIEQYSGKINTFVKEFVETFCNKNGSIDWEKLVKYNSSK